jgi:predicted transcriptional regulator
MENTIMTEKIGRRGIKTPVSYEPDILEKKTVSEVMNEDAILLSEENNIGEVREWIEKEGLHGTHFFIIINKEHNFSGVISTSDILSNRHHPDTSVELLNKQKNIAVSVDDSLRFAVEKMAAENMEVIPIISKENKIIGVLSYKDIIAVYHYGEGEHAKKATHISLKRQRLKIIVHGQKMVAKIKSKVK